MLDLTKYEQDEKFAELVAEIKKMRDAGGHLSEVAAMVSAEQEPVHPDCLKCEHIDQRKAKEALAMWRAI